jgi:acyl-CoA thioester hydrolase
MAIAHHGSYLLWLEEARVEYLRRRGSHYGDWVARGIHLPVIDVRIRYRAPARFDEALVVETWIGEISRVAVRFDYRVWRGEQIIAEAYTTLACVDDRHRPTRVPQDVVDQVLRDETK